MNNMQQQSPFEWMKFIRTPGEKHLGIAVIRYERRFIFRFKVMPSDHGGYWVTSASMKTGTANGKDKYEAAFSFDSDYEKSQLTDFVLACLEQEMQNSQQNTSVFGSNNGQNQAQNGYNQGQFQTQNGQNHNQSARPSSQQQPNMFQQQAQQQTVFDDNIPF